MTKNAEKTNFFQFFLGIDISKKTLDYCLLSNNGKVVLRGKVSNNNKGILLMLNHLQTVKISLSEVLVCCENTGTYTMPLRYSFSSKEMAFWVVSALEIKRSKGITRGKSDKTDAKDIVLYGLRNDFNYQPSVLPSADLQQLKILQAEAEKLKKCIKVMSSTKENIGFYNTEILKAVLKENDKAIKSLKKSLKVTEDKIFEIIKNNKTLKQQYDLINSIRAIGKQTAIYLIITTEGFSKFNTWRQLACYAGVVPFEYSSGTSIRGRTKVHHFADKKLKSLLHMCAMSSVKNDKELKEYYQRKQTESKNKMLVLNNIRCKLLSRVFAVIKRDSPFVNLYKYAA